MKFKTSYFICLNEKSYLRYAMGFEMLTTLLAEQTLSTQNFPLWCGRTLWSTDFASSFGYRHYPLTHLMMMMMIMMMVLVLMVLLAVVSLLKLL